MLVDEKIRKMGERKKCGWKKNKAGRENEGKASQNGRSPHEKGENARKRMKEKKGRGGNKEKKKKG